MAKKRKGLRPKPSSKSAPADELAFFVFELRRLQDELADLEAVVFSYLEKQGIKPKFGGLLEQ